MVWLIVLACLLCGLVLWDLLGKSRVLLKGFVVLPYLLAAPHTVLLWRLALGAPVPLPYPQKVSILIALTVFSCYLWFRFHLFPISRDCSESMRMRVLLGGARITRLGIWAVTLGIPLTVWLYIKTAEQIPWGYLLADGIVTVVSWFFLLCSGVLRMFFTSYRMGVWRRVITLLVWWIPVFQLFWFLYLARLARDEFDYEENKRSLRSVRAQSQLCKTRYPLLFVHGVGFRDLKYFNYWGRIPKELIRNGAVLDYGHQEAWGTIESNAHAMVEKVEQMLRETGCEKVNIIAHSKGGLDARCLASLPQMQGHIASITTISSPHKGCRMVDVASSKLPEGLYRRLAKGVDWYFRKLGDTAPDFYTVTHQFTTSFCRGFDAAVPLPQGVYCQSYTSVMKGALSHFLLTIPYLIVRGLEGDNDGLVAVDSAKWGNFRGVVSSRGYRGISHGDIIDLKRQDYKGFDVLEFYVQLVSQLREKGF